MAPKLSGRSLYLQTTFLVQSCCKSIKDHILVVSFKLSRLVGFLAFCSSSVCVRFFFIKCYLFQWNMESCPLLWNDTSEEESVNGNHWNRWGEMFVILKHKLLQRLVHDHVGRKNDWKNWYKTAFSQCCVSSLLFKRNYVFSFFLQNEKKKRKLSETSSEITEMKVKYLRYNVS